MNVAFSTEQVLSVLGQVLIVMGALLFSTAGIGLLRLRDAYARSSAIATAAGMGISLVLVGVFLLDPDLSNGFKLVAAIVLQLATSAVGSMAIARSAYLTGVPMHTDAADPLPDELAGGAGPQ